MSNKIVIELCAEDRARLDAIIDGLQNRSAAPVETLTTDFAASFPDPQPEPEPAPVEAPAPAPVPSLAEFQKAITLRCAESAAVKTKVRALVNRFAPSVSEIPEEKRAEFLDLLSKL